jgi:histidine triad (HIT) family protein
MMDCLFCKIIAGDIPSKMVYSDSDVVAFLDIAPVNDGHVLVVPRKHSVDLLDMDDSTVSKVFLAAKKVAAKVVIGVGASGFNLGMNNGKVSGQVVFHSHVHIMPRFEGDGYKLWNGKPYSSGEMEKVFEKIK